MLHRARHRNYRCSSLLALMLGIGLLSNPTGLSRGEEKQNIPAPAQPVPFNHRRHAELGLECKFCHELPDPGKAAGFPSTAKCVACHQTVSPNKPWFRKLIRYHRQAKAIPWVRVYQLPGYVFFDRRNHLEAGATCVDCHGEVEIRHDMRKEKEISMAACVDCHLAQSASINCGFCHTLGLSP